VPESEREFAYSADGGLFSLFRQGSGRHVADTRDTIMAETLSFVFVPENHTGLTGDRRNRISSNPEYIMVNATPRSALTKRVVIEIEYADDNLLPLHVEHDFRWPPTVRQAELGVA
jgi:hypothetical protein